MSEKDKLEQEIDLKIYSESNNWMIAVNALNSGNTRIFYPLTYIAIALMLEHKEYAWELFICGNFINITSIWYSLSFGGSVQNTREVMAHIENKWKLEGKMRLSDSQSITKSGFGSSRYRYTFAFVGYLIVSYMVAASIG